jgi:hypothetical protein
MATKSKKNDENKAVSRYVDQPGQWTDRTPAAVKKRQQRDWAKLHKMLEEDKKAAAKKKKN